MIVAAAAVSGEGAAHYPSLVFSVVKRFNYLKQKKWCRYFHLSVGRFWMAHSTFVKKC